LSGERHFFSWPGLGHEPHASNIHGIDDLVSRVLSRLHSLADLVAQSMGGLVAIKTALAAPGRARRLVLKATSGGVPVADLGGVDWRADYKAEFPNAASWITEVHEDLSAHLGAIDIPVLLLWGSADAISPPAVGQKA
jgi:pimeloyl-ACP methyl ester carboxylesterase